MKTAILGAGKIAGTLAVTMRSLAEVECYAVASRSLEKAQQFAAEHGFQKAYGSYSEMLADEEVELVYIATPHSHHYEHMKLCIEAGKHVLCEKAFTTTREQAEEIFRLAKERDVLVTEAIWTRYMPYRANYQRAVGGGRYWRGKDTDCQPELCRFRKRADYPAGTGRRRFVGCRRLYAELCPDALREPHQTEAVCGAAYRNGCGWTECHHLIL